MLFEYQIQEENNGVMYSIEIVDPDSTASFVGVPASTVWCSGCVLGSPCKPSNAPTHAAASGTRPRPPPRPRASSTPLTVAIVLLVVIVLAGSFAACKYMCRAFQDSRSSQRRGRDFYPSTGEADNETLTG